mmetsp:Transcript_6316/g.17633  ORF Transcript_6316/g.17633 Transcript_6316/m.17633 type:complete len:115 (-) Transcript_6316:408-752(-)
MQTRSVYRLKWRCHYPIFREQEECCDLVRKQSFLTANWAAIPPMEEDFHFSYIHGRYASGTWATLIVLKLCLRKRFASVLGNSLRQESDHLFFTRLRDLSIIVESFIWHSIALV